MQPQRYHTKNSCNTQYIKNIQLFQAYIKSFTTALRYEYAKDGLTIQHLSPMFINTKMNQFSHRLQVSSTFVPDATTYAKYAASTLGKMDVSTGYWTHGIQVI